MTAARGEGSSADGGSPARHREKDGKEQQDKF